MDVKELLEGLNAEQVAAVEHGEGPLMIVAGAGTGKTTVITRRIAWLIAKGQAQPQEILALTFTEKAATEMEERVDRLLPLGYLDLSISTFHAFCEQVLRTHGLHIGLAPDFKVANEVDAWLLMRRHLNAFTLDYFKPLGNPTKFFRSLLQHFSRAQDEGVSPEEYLAWVEDLVTSKSGGGPEAFAALQDEDKFDLLKWQELAQAYATYSQLLVEQGWLDFGNLLTKTVQLFEQRPNILKEYLERFKYLVVDEFQDTNTVQYRLIKLLAGTRRNITVVGDDDQAIYKFRGAALANILSFREDFPDTQKVVLTNNYRSGKEILDHAYKLIQVNNPYRLEVTEGLSKELRSHLLEPGFVKHLHCPTVEDEVETTVKEIVRLHNEQGGAWSDCCILVRANDAADPFLEALERAGVPFQFVALSGLYTQPVILDTLAYMRLLHLSDHGPATYRVLSHPRLGLDQEDLSSLLSLAKRKGLSLLQAVDRAVNGQYLSADSCQRLIELQQILKTLRQQAKRLPVTELFLAILKQTGLLADIGSLPEAEQVEVYAQLEGFLSRLKRFANGSEDKQLPAFLDEFEAERAAGEAGSLASSGDDDPDVVRVMTVHGAKGLEFAYVFVVNLIEQRFPSVNRSEALPLPPGLAKGLSELDDHVAEERRLFYVAMTRAKFGLYLLSADDYGGTRIRKPSRFLTELGFAPITQEKSRTKELVESVAKPVKPSVNYKVPERISFSQVAAYTTCPLQYKYAHLLKVPAFGRPTFSFGKTMHNTLQHYLSVLQVSQTTNQASLFAEPAESPKELPGLDALLDLYRRNFIDEWFASDEEREAYRDLGQEALKGFYAKIILTPPRIYALEKGFSLKVANVLVKGRIDRIDELADGSLEIIDYKTGKPKNKLTYEDRRQLILYSLALAKLLPDKPVSKLTFYYLNNNEATSFAPNAKDQDRLIEDIQLTMERIEARDFEPDPDPVKCSYCDFKDICPFAAA